MVEYVYEIILQNATSYTYILTWFLLSKTCRQLYKYKFKITMHIILNTQVLLILRLIEEHIININFHNFIKCTHKKLSVQEYRTSIRLGLISADHAAKLYITSQLEPHVKLMSYSKLLYLKNMQMHHDPNYLKFLENEFKSIDTNIRNGATIDHMSNLLIFIPNLNLEWYDICTNYLRNMFSISTSDEIVDWCYKLMINDANRFIFLRAAQNGPNNIEYRIRRAFY